MSPTRSTSPTPARRRRSALRHGAAASLTMSAAGLLVAGFALSGAAPAYAATAIELGDAESFAVLAASKIENVGGSVVSGNVGITGVDFTGFPPGVINDGVPYVTTPEAAAAEVDFGLAYVAAAGAPADEDLTGTDLGGLTLEPGVYEDTSTMQLTGELVLDGGANDVWIFQAGSSLTTAPGARVTLVNGARACNVFWQVTSSATLDSGNQFVGTILALASITVGSGSDVQGRLLAGAAVSMNTNDITRPAPCAAAATTAPPTTSATPGDDDDDNGGGGGGNGNGGSNGGGNAGGEGGNGGDDGSGVARGPVVPVGNPDTGMTPDEEGGGGPAVLYGLVGLVALGALLTARTLRTTRTH
ncbi:ice-binding family protein [Nocardioides sp. 503]|uniref:ice-binding family protein n=1 Tax=Nocardioides sp. 503 TaxID=2508326 RepID=UPI00106F94DA|nr:ice-binding family protein [Nocardioides sp. 503]